MTPIQKAKVEAFQDAIRRLPVQAETSIPETRTDEDGNTIASVEPAVFRIGKSAKEIASGVFVEIKVFPDGYMLATRTLPDAWAQKVAAAYDRVRA